MAAGSAESASAAENCHHFMLQRLTIKVWRLPPVIKPQWVWTNKIKE